MPFTYTWQNAIDLVREFGHGIPVATVDSQIVDIIQSWMWIQRPWRWTVQEISPALTLVDGTQDYDAPVQIYRLVRARFKRTDVTPNEYDPPLDPVEFLEPDHIKYSYKNIRKISQDYPSGKLRLEAPVSISGGVTVVLEGDYQPHPVKVADANLSSGIWFPDQYLGVLVEGIKWKIYQLLDDPRSGTVVIARDGRRQFSGQLSIFLTAFEEMKLAEDVTGVPIIYPAETLGSKATVSTLFGGLI